MTGHAQPSLPSLTPQEEALIVTGHADPELAAAHVLSRPGARTEWCVVKLGKEGALLRSRSEGKSYRMQGMQVGRGSSM